MEQLSNLFVVVGPRFYDKAQTKHMLLCAISINRIWDPL